MCRSVTVFQKQSDNDADAWTVTLITEPTRGPRKAFELDRSSEAYITATVSLRLAQNSIVREAWTQSRSTVQ